MQALLKPLIPTHMALQQFAKFRKAPGVCKVGEMQSGGETQEVHNMNKWSANFLTIFQMRGVGKIKKRIGCELENTIC